jgi:hypothetical protein
MDVYQQTPVLANDHCQVILKVVVVVVVRVAAAAALADHQYCDLTIVIRRILPLCQRIKRYTFTDPS